MPRPVIVKHLCSLFEFKTERYYSIATVFYGSQIGASTTLDGYMVLHTQNAGVEVMFFFMFLVNTHHHYINATKELKEKKNRVLAPYPLPPPPSCPPPPPPPAVYGPGNYDHSLFL